MQKSVVDHLRLLIIRRQLEPGERLVQSDLAEQLGVSRTPIREALQELASEGLVTLSPYKSASVAEYSPVELEEIYSVRIALERYAGRLASQHITDDEIARLEHLVHQMEGAIQREDISRLIELHRDFNDTLYGASRHTRLHELIMQHVDLSIVYWHVSFRIAHRAEQTVAEQSELLAAVRAHDTETLVELIEVHLQHTASILFDYFDRQHE